MNFLNAYKYLQVNQSSLDRSAVMSSQNASIALQEGHWTLTCIPDGLEVRETVRCGCNLRKGRVSEKSEQIIPKPNQFPHP